MGKLKRKKFQNRNEWLAGRSEQGIGASEAAACLGLSKWQTPVQLWRIMTGLDNRQDLSGNAAVARGHRVEPGIRALFGSLHPEYKIEYHEFDLLYQDDRPWQFATLDGELIKEDGTRGILEIKTAEPQNAAHWAEWSDGHVPMNYYCQICHQLLATGYDFEVLAVLLFRRNGDKVYREYEFDRIDMEADMQFVLSGETQFMEHVKSKTMPALPLKL